MIDLSVEVPGERLLGERYAQLQAEFDKSEAPQAKRRVFDAWDATRRAWRSHANLTRLNYTLDTRREDCRAAISEIERRSPRVISLDSSMQKRFLAPGARRPLETELGAQAFDLWSADVAAFDDALSADLVLEAETARKYVELVSGVEVEFRGERKTLAALGAFTRSSDRETRHDAERARWKIFSDRREQLDAIYGDLVTLRDRMARKLGDENYLALGYRRMHRVDYGPSDVARYRDEVVRVVVPAVRRLIERLGRKAGFERVYFWDEAVLGAGRSPVPQGDGAWVVARGVEALAAIDPALGEFGRMMAERGLLDVVNRPGKAVGAYCTSFPTEKVPFVFANFDGTRGDVKTLMHELGHAFQSWRSREKPLIDYLTPTLESAEIHSMSLEYLSWPEMGRFFGDRAADYRNEHLLDALLFLPYGVAIDHFQHLVYAQPSATPAERHEMWREVERRYLPWRDYGDLEHPNRGGLWQEKRHVYSMPFYYIDYTLALCCALQFWHRANNDRRDALDAYVALCGRGGEAPFGELVRSAGLKSPFEPGTLEDVVASAEAVLTGTA